MKIIIGLGNPDKKYQNTRHNIGQIIIKSLPPTKNLLITDTYMNESGVFVQKIVHFYKIDPRDLYIIHDDLDLPVGEWRLQFGRGPAGHKGVESVVSHLGSQDFWRFRLGIGHPRDSSNPGLPVEDYVLMPFTPPEQVLIEAVIAKIITEIKNLHQS